MILGVLGRTILWGSLAATTSAAILLAAGLHWRRGAWLKAGVLAVRLTFLLVTAAMLLLSFALLNDRFELVYVANHSRQLMAWPYKLGALWSGQAGSLLLWLWLLTAYTALLSWRSRPAEDHGHGLLLPALAVLSALAIFFAFLVAWVESPFRVHLPAPADGRGMNPLLQNPSMLAHPLLVYSGFVGFSVPYAFAVAALWRCRRDAAWLQRTRRWTLLAWLLLSLGILIGAQWSYIELGWGGYWAWDPVENASLLPWLTATAFLHSSMVQERRGLLKGWNVGLVFATYALSILGTFITRSGILASVHAFAQSPIGPWFVAYLGLVLAASVYLLVGRQRLLRQTSHFESYLSREVGFHLNNLLLMAVAIAVLWGTLFPVVSRFRGVEVTVGAPFYNRVAGPLLLAVIVLMGLGPVLAWRKTAAGNLVDRLWVPCLAALACLQGLLLAGLRQPIALTGFPLIAFAAALTLAEIARDVRVRRTATGQAYSSAAWSLFLGNRRRYGGYVVHLGILLIAAGVLASSNLAEQVRVPLRLGESVTVGPYQVQYLGLGREVEDGVPKVFADLAVRADGRLIAFVRPAKRYFPGVVETMGPTTEIAVLGGGFRDLYVVLAGFDEAGTVAGFELAVKPLVGWIWAGGYLVMFGTLFSLWPSRRRPAFSRYVERLLEELDDLEHEHAAGKLDPAAYQRRRQELAVVLAERLAVERELEARFDALVRDRLGDAPVRSSLHARRPAAGVRGGN